MWLHQLELAPASLATPDSDSALLLRRINEASLHLEVASNRTPGLSAAHLRFSEAIVLSDSLTTGSAARLRSVN